LSLVFVYLVLLGAGGFSPRFSIKKNTLCALELLDAVPFPSLIVRISLNYAMAEGLALVLRVAGAS
jgi:hypothetical protein